MKSLVVRLGLIASLLACVNTQAQSSGSSNGSATPGSSNQDRGSDKLDLRKLEEKYWSAKDTDFAVVQNRAYTKEKKFFASVSYGPLMNDPYFNGRQSGFNFGYYFSERIGVEVAYEKGNLKDNDSTSFMARPVSAGGFDTRPDTNRYDNYTSINFLIVPFYAKMSFWNRSIIYFDMQFGLGVGNLSYVQTVDPTEGGDRPQSVMGMNFDITQQMFFHEHWAVRFDIKNKFTSQERLRYELNVGEPESTRSLGKFPIQDTSILFGVTYFF